MGSRQRLEVIPMKKWRCLLTNVSLIFSATLAPSTASSELAAHHELIGSAGKQVEIYWAAPPRAQDKLPVVVYIHGVQGEGRPGAKNFVDGGLLEVSAAKGYLSIGMSMPGYGRSTGKADFCGAQTQAALRSVLSRVRTWPTVDRKRIIVSGLSCGAVAAAMVADKEPLAGMVLISGVYDFADMYQKWHTPAWPLEPATMQYIDDSAAADGTPENASARRSALANASRFRSPVLLVAQGPDRIVDPEQSVRMNRALIQAGKESTLILNPEGAHAVSYEEWAGYVNDFARRIFGR
jgi:dipeptidyl aminopeptidase/acylaminoacyl peptidase